MGGRRINDLDLVRQAMHTAYPIANPLIYSSPHKPEGNGTTTEPSRSWCSSPSQYAYFEIPPAVSHKRSVINSVTPPTSDSTGTNRIFEHGLQSKLAKKSMADDDTEDGLKPSIPESSTTSQCVGSAINIIHDQQVDRNQKHYMSGALHNTDTFVSEEAEHRDFVDTERTPSLWEEFGFQALGNPLETSGTLCHGEQPLLNRTMEEQLGYDAGLKSMGSSLQTCLRGKMCGDYHPAMYGQPEPLHNKADVLHIYSPATSSSVLCIGQRHGSEASQESATMEISPEDQFAPRIKYHQQNVTELREDDLNPGTGKRHKCLTRSPSLLEGDSSQDLSLQSAQENDCRVHLSWPTEQLHSTCRPNPSNCLRTELSHSFNIFDDTGTPLPHPYHDESDTGSPLPTPSHMTPLGHSPLRWLGTPHAVQFPVAASVERDIGSSLPVRESTPAYEDRSFSPSPTSQMGTANSTSSADADMIDTCAMDICRKDQEASVLPESPRPTVMLPPPSSSRSITSSPTMHVFGGASPSILRSPAIARVIDLSQSPHRQTQYPSHCRSMSPMNYHHSNLSSDSQPIGSPVPWLKLGPSILALRASPGPLEKSLFPAPPPIPDNSTAFIKQAKRSARRKSAATAPGTKVTKTRSVTVTSVATKGHRTVTGARKNNRAVTAVLVESLAIRDDGDERSAVVDGGCRSDCGPDAVMDLDGPVQDATDVNGGSDETYPDTGSVRRSARLRSRRLRNEK